MAAPALDGAEHRGRLAQIRVVRAERGRADRDDALVVRGGAVEVAGLRGERAELGQRDRDVGMRRPDRAPRTSSTDRASTLARLVDLALVVEVAAEIRERTRDLGRRRAAVLALGRGERGAVVTLGIGVRARGVRRVAERVLERARVCARSSGCRAAAASRSGASGVGLGRAAELVEDRDEHDHRLEARGVVVCALGESRSPRARAARAALASPVRIARSARRYAIDADSVA